MKILFVHQNFPGQFKFLAPALAAEPGNTVVAMTMQKAAVQEWQGVRLVSYAVTRGSTPQVHPWVSDLETKVIRGEAALKAARQMRSEGFEPDLILAHPGWGESLFLKDVWPKAHLSIYCEFYYQPEGSDINFDPEFLNPNDEAASRLRLKNAFYTLQFPQVDSAISPTRWQASTFPGFFRDRITVIHDGIDTDAITPNPAIQMRLKDRSGTEVTLDKNSEVITFVSRNLEPYRGYHVFMRALPQILKDRPNARVVLVGGNDVSYGARHSSGKSWRDVMIDEVQTKISAEDWRRVHFIGKVPYPQFIGLLQLSTVHVYLTYPFVLSWSLLESMSAGCAIIASDTAPVKEVITDGKTGVLVDFFDAPGLAQSIHALLEDPKKRLALGKAARHYAQKNVDLKSVCLPKQIKWVKGLCAR